MTEQPEYFDIYDGQGRPLGRAKERSAVHRDGDIHRSAHLWIYTGEGRLLLQRRAADKDTWPSVLDASMGGHYHAGEPPTEGVLREVREELGLTVALTDLVPLGQRYVESRPPGVIDREIQDIYLLRCDLPLAAYHPDPIEVASLVLANATEIAALHAGTIDSIVVEELRQGESRSQQSVITAQHLIPKRGPYLITVADAISDLLAGRPPREMLHWTPQPDTEE